eukprot:PLAT15166.1.p1 GENE.PLAT15166.1~~PLAT15166.1.p1  ORF type:complete len:634 (+),score=266.13 PLAT15166.1:41-1942(+)
MAPIGRLLLLAACCVAVVRGNAYQWNDRAHNDARVSALVAWAESGDGKSGERGNDGGDATTVLLQERAAEAEGILSLWRRGRVAADAEAEHRRQLLLQAQDVAAARRSADVMRGAHSVLDFPLLSPGARGSRDLTDAAYSLLQLDSTAVRTAALRAMASHASLAPLLAARRQQPSLAASERAAAGSLARLAWPFSSAAHFPLAASLAAASRGRAAADAALLQLSADKAGKAGKAGKAARFFGGGGSPAERAKQRAAAQAAMAAAAAKETAALNWKPRFKRRMYGPKGAATSGLLVVDGTARPAAHSVGEDSASSNGAIIGCGVCQFLMEEMELATGYANSDLQSDGNSPYLPRAWTGYPGPAAYFQDAAGRAPFARDSYSALPGPGYAWLQMASRTSKLLSDEQDELHQRLLAEADAVATADVPNTGTGMPAMAAAAAGTPAAAAAAFIQPMPLTTASAELSAETLPSMVAMRDGWHVAVDSAAASARAAASRHAALPDAQLFEGAMRFVELSAAERSAMAAHSRFVGGLAARASGCRSPKMFCRAKLHRQRGYGQKRNMRRVATDAKYAAVKASFNHALIESCARRVPSGLRHFCDVFAKGLNTAADEYIHDYDDDDICTDIGMCKSTDLVV